MHEANRENTRRTVVASVLLLAMAAGCSGQPPAGSDAQSDITLFEGARLIAGDGTEVENAAFLVNGDRFVAIGRAGELTAPDGAARVDLAGKTVMPAIIDTHAHLATERDALVRQLQHKAYYGNGVVMSLGTDTGELPYAIRDETLPDAARFRTAGRGITTPEPGRSENPYWVTTEAQARQAVRELAARRVDLVKIWVDDRNGQYEKLSPALYGAIIDEAHRHDLRVTAHLYSLDDAKALVRAGVDAFAHSVRDRDIDDEFLALVKARPEFVQVPNLSDPGRPRDLSWLSETVSAEELSTLQTEASASQAARQEVFAVQARNLARLNAAGIKIALGTDGSAAWAAQLEMADMVSAGMTPAEVIVAATRHAAELLGLRDVGTIAAGMSADFIVLDANPLEDIMNLRRIAAVYLRGSMVDRAAMRQPASRTGSGY